MEIKKVIEAREPALTKGLQSKTVPSKIINLKFKFHTFIAILWVVLQQNIMFEKNLFILLFTQQFQTNDQ